MSNVKTFDAEVQQRIEEVSGKFNAFIARQKTEIVQAQEEYAGKINQLRNEQRELLKSLEELKKKEVDLNRVLEREIIDSNSSESRLNDLRTREKQLQEERTTLESQLKNLKERVDARREEYSSLRQNQQKQAEINLPETLVYEQLLGFKIVGIREDLLKLVFKNIDPKDVSREYSLELDVSEHLYKVGEVSPSISEEDLKKALDFFNESRNFAHFLKDVRTLFKSLQ